MNFDFELRYKEAIEMAKICGEIAKEGYYGEAGVEIKDGRELVTKYDKAIELKMKALVAEKFPEDIFMGEEYDNNLEMLNSDKPVWIIDPIDGTNNFAHKIPIFAISIGVIYKGESQLGVVFNPIINEMFTALKGHGAFLNDKAISVSTNDTMKNSIMATGFPYKRTCMEDSNVYEISRVLLSATGLRRMGAASIDICYVAAGRMDGYWETGLKPWDVAGGIAIAHECGAQISDYNGDEYIIGTNDFVVTNGKVHGQLLSCVQKRK